MQYVFIAIIFIETNEYKRVLYYILKIDLDNLLFWDICIYYMSIFFQFLKTW